MIAVDTSSFISYLQGDEGEDVSVVDWTLESNQLVLPPVVLTEMLSDPRIPQKLSDLLQSIPLLEISQGYWGRAGQMRSKLLALKLRARLADALVAQSCIDYQTPLITRDRDFDNFSNHSELKLATEI